MTTIDSTPVSSHTGGENIDLIAHPKRCAAGSIVLLVATLPPNSESNRGTEWNVTWRVIGPTRLSGHDTRIALLGTTSVTGDRIMLDDRKVTVIRATLDTSPLSEGAWIVQLLLTKIGDDRAVEAIGGEDGDEGPVVLRGEASPIEVTVRPFAAGDDVSVSLKRAAVPPTNDQALWVSIRSSTNELGFDNFSRFLDGVMCGEWAPRSSSRVGGKKEKHLLHKVKRHIALPFPNVDRYRLLKAATEVFLMVHCGVDRDFHDLDLDAESRRLNRVVRPGDLETELRNYLTRIRVPGEDDLEVLPYLGLIRQKLRDVSIVGGSDDEDEAAGVCYGILAEKLANPCFLELLWSYWGDEGGLVQTLNAISWRFQNRMGPGSRDPLAGMDIDPLRPLNNLLWGWIQDTPHRLNTVRRAYEYDHHYGLVLAAKPGPPVRGADSRSRFIEAFHNLLALCCEFYLCDDDTTRIADGFGVLNALKETHLLLTQGAHNAYGDLPWTARHEMLMTQWILGRPEMREILPTRTMVVYPETWMHPVEAMNRLQGWTDISVLHFRDLAVFGEQLLLGIRFGAWTQVIEPEQAANWARYWRAEVQGYIHSYRAVTGVDLTKNADASMPAFHLRRRHNGRRA